MIELREHQTQAHEATVSAIDAGEKRMILEMATGSGKSFTQGALLFDQSSKGAMLQSVFVPSQDLVGQNAQAYRTYFQDHGQDVNIIGVFAPNEEKLRDGLDTITTSATELVDAIDPNRPTVVISSYASSEAVAQAATYGVKFDTMLCDEAHRMASSESIENAGKWSAPLFDEQIPADKRIFYTATMRTDGPDEDVSTIAMNNQELFGRKIYELGYEEAVERGILNRYTPYPVEIERADIEVAMTEAGLERTDETDGVWRGKERAFAAVLMSQAALDNRRASGEPLSMMVLHPSRARAEDYTSEMASHMSKRDESVPCITVHGEAQEQKEQALAIGRSLKGEMACSVVDMFREGTDMPGLNTLMVARNSQSSILLIQAMGRVVRLYKDDWAKENGGVLPKKNPHIYVPVIVDGRDPNDRPDCSMAANLFSAMLRMDDGARRSFEKANGEQGRADLLDEEIDDPVESAVASAFKMKDTPTTRRLAAAIASETREKDTIGRFDYYASMYEAHLQKHNFEAPTLPTKAERQAATTSSEKKALENRHQMVAWHASVSARHSKKMLLDEEVARVYAIKGFAFSQSSPDKLVGHFEAMKHHAGDEKASYAASATAPQSLLRLVKEGGMIALQGQRTNAAGKAVAAQKGDADLAKFAQQLSLREAARGQLPSILSQTSEEPVQFRANVEMITCPLTATTRRALVPHRHEPLPGTSAKAVRYQPALPVEAIEQSAHREALFNAPLGSGVTIVAGRTSSATLSVSKMDIKPSDEKVAAMAQMVEQVGSFSHLTRAGIKGRENQSPQVTSNWTGTNADLVKQAAQLRAEYAAGTLDNSVVERFSRLPNFSWISREDLHKTVKVRGKEVPQIQAGFARLVKENPVRDEAAMGENTTLGNSLRESRRLYIQTRQLSEQVKDKGASDHKKKMTAFRAARDIVAPHLDEYKRLASMTAKKQIEKAKAVETKVARDVQLS